MHLVSRASAGAQAGRAKLGTKGREGDGGCRGRQGEGEPPPSSKSCHRRGNIPLRSDIALLVSVFSACRHCKVNRAEREPVPVAGIAVSGWYLLFGIPDRRTSRRTLIMSYTFRKCKILREQLVIAKVTRATACAVGA